LLHRPQGSGPLLEVLTDIEVRHNVPFLVLLPPNIEFSHVCLRLLRELLNIWIAYT